MAASLPVNSAARSWRRLTVGSSSYSASPTSASAIALRMAALGRVTVSERRSIGDIGCPLWPIWPSGPDVVRLDSRTLACGLDRFGAPSAWLASRGRNDEEATPAERRRRRAGGVLLHERRKPDSERVGRWLRGWC